VARRVLRCARPTVGLPPRSSRPATGISTDRFFALGIDGWWPDEGDPLDGPSRLVRNRMYWEEPQLDRPDERPFALHRNGYAGMQRYASFLWSGDVYSTWDTLRTHIPVAINTGLSGIPYWARTSAALSRRRNLLPSSIAVGSSWAPSARCSVRTGGPGSYGSPGAGTRASFEIANYGGAGLPRLDELHHAEVEPICRKYLELRYRLLPYLYSAVRECTKTGVPVIPALWLHYPDDPVAAGRGDEYLWGRDIVVAPVVEKGATSRRLYLPEGVWYDFWTSERVEGGRELARAVDLETMPLYVCAGTILPLGPVKQYTEERVEARSKSPSIPALTASFLFTRMTAARSITGKAPGWASKCPGMIRAAC
jgi:alpha-glucosidase/alpha-D-xyloside xylohydrolase